MKLNKIDYNGELVEYKMSRSELTEFIQQHLPTDDITQIDIDNIKDLCFSVDEDHRKDQHSKIQISLFISFFIIVSIVIVLGLWKTYELLF